jgi:Reverse transcriptase (RNA-dependent DNA polymerase)
MIKAVIKLAPQLLRGVMWMYKHASPLWIADSPDPIRSKRGVRQGDPLGPLLFALTLQDVLHAVAFWNEYVRVTGYLDEGVLQGTVNTLVNAYWDLEKESAKAGLFLQKDKCTSYSANESNVRELARLVGCKVSTDGIVAAGCPTGKPSFVTQEAIKSAQKVVALVRKLNDIELSAQDKLLLLRTSFQVKVSHLARRAEYKHIKQALHMVARSVMQAILQIIGRGESMLESEQLMLPLRCRITLPVRHGGIGVHFMSDRLSATCDASFLSATVLTCHA